MFGRLPLIRYNTKATMISDSSGFGILELGRPGYWGRCSGHGEALIFPITIAWTFANNMSSSYRELKRLGLITSGFINTIIVVGNISIYLSDGQIVASLLRLHEGPIYLCSSSLSSSLSLSYQTQTHTIR